MTRLRVSRWMVSARGLVFLIFTNRYVFHAVLITISLATIGSQIQAKYATASEVGKHSLLYTLVSDQAEQTIEESVEPGTLTRNTNYLGYGTITDSANFYYSPETNPRAVANATIPGSIDAAAGIDTDLDPDLADDVTSEVHVDRTKTETYTIADGDTVASIAQRFGVNVATIIWANNLDSRALIKPGSSLKIPAASGVLLTVRSGDTIAKLAQRYNVSAEAIATANRLENTSALAAGEDLLIPGATPLAQTSSAPSRTTVAVRPDVPITRIKDKAYDIYQELTTKPTDNRAKPTSIIPAAAEEAKDTVKRTASTKLLWPTRLHVINQYYGWKHTGVDLDGDYTDPIYASEDGVVAQAGWNNGGYGLMILINHQNGLKTRYGHASKLFVAAGDTVKRGQVIAMVGTTGRSTGTHLHYEVYNGTVRQNPLSYIR